MDKLETKSFNKLVEKIQSNLDVQEVIIKKQNEKLLMDYQKSISESKIKDERIKLLLEKKSNASGDLAERYNVILDSYIEEQKKNNKLGTRDQKRIEKLLQEQKNVLDSKEKEKEISKQLNRKEELVNPLNALKHGFEDYKDSKKNDKSTWKSLKDGTNTLSKSLKESASQQFTFKNLTKSILHGTGVALDLPALNILASSIDSDVNQRQDDNIELQNTLSEMSALNPEENKVINDSVAFAKAEESKLDANKSSIENISNLENLENITKEMHKDLSDELVDIYVENSDLTKLFKEFMYFQRDLADDKKDKKESSFGSDINASEENKVETPSILDSFSDMFGGTTGTSGKNGKGGKFSKASKFGKFAKVGGGALAALTAGYSKYSDVEGDSSLSTSQKTTQVASTATGAGAGALAGAALGQTIIPVPLLGALIGGAVGGIAGSSVGSAIGDYTSGLIGDKKSTTFVNSLESQGAVKTSWMGDSQVTDWNIVKNLDENQLKLMLRYDDWNSETEKRLQELITHKQKQSISNTESNNSNIESNNSNIESNNSNTIKVKTNKSEDIMTSALNTSNQVLETPAPAVVEAPRVSQQPERVQKSAPTTQSKQGNKESKIDSFKMEEVEIRKYMLDRGLL